MPRYTMTSPRPRRPQRRRRERGRGRTQSTFGVTISADGANVAVYSAHAEAIEFCLFGDRGGRSRRSRASPCRGEQATYAMAYIPGVRPARATACAPMALLRRSTACVSIPRSFSPILTPSRSTVPSRCTTRCSIAASTAPVSRRESRAQTPSSAPVGEPGRLRIPWAKTIIYELNLRGFTRLDPGCPEA